MKVVTLGRAQVYRAQAARLDLEGGSLTDQLIYVLTLY